jgi:hypothetical protein
MDIEFHYYITHILAEKAGFGPEASQTIAYSSQYVDNNDRQYTLDKGKEDEYQNYISQTMDILKPKKEHLRIYPCFHFVPGEYESYHSKRKDGRTHPLNTTPNSKNSNVLMDRALKTDNLYRLGIATHCYADTWAHQNFVGCDDKFNELMGILEIFIPNIGHADALHKPDRPYLIWEDQRLLSANRKIHNKHRFLEAAKNIFAKYAKHVDKRIKKRDIDKGWSVLEPKLIWAMGKERKNEGGGRKERIGRYQSIARDMKLYRKDTWFKQAIETKRLRKKTTFNNSHWYKFQEAVKEHQKTAIELLKQRFEQIGFVEIENF